MLSLMNDTQICLSSMREVQKKCYESLSEVAVTSRFWFFFFFWNDRVGIRNFLAWFFSGSLESGVGFGYAEMVENVS